MIVLSGIDRQRSGPFPRDVEARSLRRMSTAADLVRSFHERFGLTVSSSPTLPSPDLAELRQALLVEEVGELGKAAARGALVDVAHELADVVYVAYGTALTYGIDLDSVIAEVHRANLTKLTPPGGGKVRKGEQFRPPDVAAVVRKQGWTE
jgi:predicted HAD superfamily Cof-like phosphohydrolase